MEQNKFLVTVMAVVMTLVSCGEKKNKQETKINTSIAETAAIVNASFSDDMTSKIFKNYQQMRLALVNSDTDDVQTAAGHLAESFSEDRDNMKLIALAMAETTDLEEQRELFSQLTEKVEPLFKESITEGSIYKQFCPMAFEGKGGFWLSNLDEIRNPYYGEKMLKCGKVVATIEK